MTHEQSSPATTVGSALRAATARLEPTSTTPRLDAELLLGYVLGWSRARLLAERSYHLAPEAVAQFQQLLERRATREPVAYLLGQREFYGLDFNVDQRVLVPRPETELLVEQVIAIAQHHSGSLRIADVGTGSGAIAVALAVHLPRTQIYASDIAPEALAVAATNINRHCVSERIHLVQGDLLATVPRPIDILVSNPPYTVYDEIDAGVRQHEPKLALDGGHEGLEVYRRLLEQATVWVDTGGWIALEIGSWQAEKLQRLIVAAFPAAVVRVHRDLAKRDRVIVAHV